MKNSFVSLSCLVGWGMLLVCGCQPIPAAIEDTQAPQIEWSYPQLNQQFRTADTVRIRAVFSDETALKKGTVHIHDSQLTAPADTVFAYRFALAGKTHLLDTFFVVQQPLDRNYTIYVSASDHAENDTQRVRLFHIRN